MKVPTGFQGGDLPRPAPWVLASTAVLLGLAAGWAASSAPGLLHLHLSPAHGAFVVALALAGVAVLHRPVLGLVALVAVVYLHLSDVLVSRHDLPSLLQLLVIPLLFVAVLEWRAKLFEGLAPWSVTVALAAYVLVFLLSTTAATEPALADARTVAAAKGFVLYALVLLLATTPGRIRAGVWALAGSGLLLAGVGLIQVLTGEYGSAFGGLAGVEQAQVFGEVVEPRIAGPVGDPNFFAQTLVIVVPLGLLLAWKERSTWLRLAGLAAAVVTAGAVLATYSRGGALALGVVVVGSLFAARPGRRRLLAAVVALMLAGALLLPDDVSRRLGTLRQVLPGQERVEELDSSFQNRILQARVAWNMFLDHPMTGVGAGNYTRHYTDYADEVGSTAPAYYRDGGGHYPHNLYLELAAETGFPGLIVFGGVILLVLGHLRRAGAAFLVAGRELHAALASALLVAVVGYLVSSLFLHGHFQLYLWLLLGLSAALIREAPTTPAAAEAGRMGGTS